jgi:HEAT repeat protein
MDAARQRLIDKAKELDTSDFEVDELQQRIREVCSEYLIEAKVDVDRLLKHPDWAVRLDALDIVLWGIGKTDGIEQAIEILKHDPDEDVRIRAALALSEASRNAPNWHRVEEAFRQVSNSSETPDDVRDEVRRFLSKLEQDPGSEVRSD